MELADVLDTEFPEPDPDIRRAAEERQRQLTKPPGSLGRLEELAVELAAWQKSQAPSARPAAAILFASDHPIAQHGVSPYPPEVTAAMVRNFLTGGAAASVLCRRFGLPLTVVDVGVDTPYAVPADSRVRLVRAPRGGEVGDLVQADGLSRTALEAAIRAGQRAIEAQAPSTRVVVLGEMGIGNTTVASALASALANESPEAWVGAGTGAVGEVLNRKRRLVRRAVERAGRAPAGELLQRLGGRDIAALVGAAARAAARGLTVLVDGFIVSSAMLALVRLRPAARPALVFAHRSSESAHPRLLDLLEAKPLIDLGLRLGEGSGALAALPLVDAACSIHGEMATFEEAAVPDREPPE